MADVFLQFRLAMLERAEAAAKKILVETEKSADLDAATRRAQVSETKGKLSEIRAAKAEVLKAQRQQRKDRLAELTEADRFDKFDAKGFKKLKGRVNLFTALGSAIKSGDLADQIGAASQLADKIPVVGDIVSVVLDAVEFGVRKLDDRAAELLEKHKAEIDRRVEERLKNLDLNERFLNDPDFAARATAIQVARDQAAEAAGYHVPYRDEG